MLRAAVVVPIVACTGLLILGCCPEAWSHARYAQVPIVATPDGKEKPKREVEQLPPATLPDAQIILLLLAQSRATYPGNCACPDDHDRAGRRCGGRSAYSRPGGRSPLCYPHDVTQAMIDAFRKSKR
jgi:hypothetical protein